MGDLRDLARRFALVGGLAVSVRTEPRLTRAADLVVLVTGDPDAEALVHDLQGRGWQVATAIEQDVAGRLAAVRLALASADVRGAVVDLLFASSGIEREIVSAADPVEAIPGFTIPVARLSHLIALKVLARDDRTRPQDRVDPGDRVRPGRAGYDNNIEQDAAKDRESEQAARSGLPCPCIYVSAVGSRRRREETSGMAACRQGSTYLTKTRVRATRGATSGRSLGGALLGLLRLKKGAHPR